MTRLVRALLDRLTSRRREAGSAPPGPADGVTAHDVAQPHDEVAGYWTDERMRDATPREQRRDLPGPDSEADE